MVAMNDTYSKETHQIAPKQTIYIYTHTYAYKYLCMYACLCSHV